MQSLCESIFTEAGMFEPSLQFAVTSQLLQVGDAILNRGSASDARADEEDELLICRSMLKPLRYLIHCVNRRQLAILVSHSFYFLLRCVVEVFYFRLANQVWERLAWSNL